MKKVFIVKLHLFFLSFLFVISSCKKDHNGNIIPQTSPDTVRSVPNGQPLITRYEYWSNEYSLFKYNNARQLTDITDINDIARTDYKVTYATDGKVDKITSKYGFSKLLYNTSNQLVQANSYNYGDTTLQSYSKFVYDGQRMVQSLTFSNYGTSVIKPRAKIDLQYDANNNAVRSDIYLWNLTSGVYEKVSYHLYEYDTHPNPLYTILDVVMVLYSGASPHNFTKAQVFNPDGSLDHSSIYKFQYNADGYPASVIENQNGPQYIQLKFEYQ